MLGFDDLLKQSFRESSVTAVLQSRSHIDHGIRFWRTDSKIAI